MTLFEAKRICVTQLLYPESGPMIRSNSNFPSSAVSSNGLCLPPTFLQVRFFLQSAELKAQNSAKADPPHAVIIATSYFIKAYTGPGKTRSF